MYISINPHGYDCIRPSWNEKDFMSPYNFIISELDCIHFVGDVMISVLTSSAVDHGFECRRLQTKDYEIVVCCFSACSIKEKEQRLVGSESGSCVRVRRPVYLRTVILVSYKCSTVNIQLRVLV